MSGRRSFQTYPSELAGNQGSGGGGGGGFTAGEDLSGSSTAQEVIGILSEPLPGLSPGFLQWTGTNWAFATPSGTFTAGGDLAGSSTVQEVVGVLSHALPSLATGFLNWTGAAWAFTVAAAIFAAGGDLSGSATSQEVVGILSHALPSLATGFLNYNGTNWVFSAVTNFVAGGDLTGSATSQEVVGIRSEPVPTLASGFLQWNGTVFAWTTPGGGFSAGGDLSGSSTVQEVIGIRSNAVPALASGFLQWNGSAFAWTTPGGGFSAGGDLSGSATTQEVVGILSHALPAIATGFLNYTGSVWAFSPANDFTAAGDLSGSATSQEVVGLLSHALPSLTSGFLEYNGTNWVFGTPSGAFTPGSDLLGNSTSTATNQYVSSLSFSSAAAGGTIAVNGTNTVLNWVTNAITLQQGGAPYVQLKATTTDFIRFGATPGTVGFLRATDGNTIIGVGGTAVFGTNGSSNTFVSSLASQLLLLQVGGTGVASFGQLATDFISLGNTPPASGMIRIGTGSGASLPLNIIETETSGGATSLLVQNSSTLDMGVVTAASPGSVGIGLTLRLFAQPAGGSANGGGSIILNAGAATTSGVPGSIILNVVAPPGAGAEPQFIFNRSSSQIAAFAFNATGSLSMLGLGTPLLSSEFYTLGADGSGNTHLSAQSGATLFMEIDQVAVAQYTATLAAFGVPIGGIPAVTPLEFAKLSAPISVASSFALSAAQASNPIIQLTGINAGITITVPNTIGATWWFDFTNVTLAGAGVTFSTGSGVSATIAAANLVVGKSVRVQVVASNTVSAG